MMNFFEQNALYVVLLITLTVWVGIAFYLQALDKKVSALEKKNQPLTLFYQYEKSILDWHNYKRSFYWNRCLYTGF